MDSIQYVGERIWASNLGSALIVLSFATALLATFSYFLATKNNSSAAGWLKLGRISFKVHTAALVGVIGLLFYLIFNHAFEFHWIWYHSNTQMPMKFIFASFWEGQEGSNLLWAFWHLLLGNILIRTAKDWEPHVMAVISSAQAFLVSLELGLVFGSYKMGSNPFSVLLREHPDFLNAPIFQNPNYLELIDGRGLNPLLQNYWMTIHPPVLFLGFAATIVPFAFAIAGLWRKEYTSWVNKALPWSMFTIAVLGVGILMGGAWAYESLSFGGFWAWDPVENAPLVAWLVLVGGAHLMLINKAKGTALFGSALMIILQFILILYSTFLTKSGVLGETSVHSFTDMGMSGQLLIYLLFYLFLGLGMLIYHKRFMPKTSEEESTWSREFWMFIGSLVLSISAFQLIFTTSNPVINKLVGPNGLIPILSKAIAPPVDVIAHYNAWQMPFAILITLFIGFTQYLKYKKTDLNKFVKSFTYSFGAAVVLTLVLAQLSGIKQPYYLAFMLSSLFAVTGNLDYLFRIQKGAVAKGGAAIAHIGFGLLLLGALVSNAGQQVISRNTSGIDVTQLGEDYNNQENILLLEGDTLKMGDYFVSYGGRKKDGIHIYYDVQFFEETQAGLQSAFTLQPFIQLNERMGNVAEPATKHFLTRDVYTYVSYAVLEDAKKESEEEQEQYMEPKEHWLNMGDTIFSSNAIIVLDTLQKTTHIDSLQDNDIALSARLSLYDFNTKKHTLLPTFVIRDSSNAFLIPDELSVLGLKIELSNINPQDGKVLLNVYEKKKNKRDFIILNAIVFPYINILWIGCIIMAIGSFIAVYQRFKLNKSLA